MIAELMLRQGKVERFYIKQMLPSNISKYCYLLYPNYYQCPSCYRLRMKIYLHTYLYPFPEVDSLYVKVVNIKENSKGLHITLKHIEHFDGKPYLKVTTDVTDISNGIKVLRIVIRPTAHCPDEIFNAFKVSLFIDNPHSHLVQLLF